MWGLRTWGGGVVFNDIKGTGSMELIMIWAAFFLTGHPPQLAEWGKLQFGHLRTVGVGHCLKQLLPAQKPTDGANLVLRVAHIRGVAKLAATSTLDRGRDKGADVVNRTTKLNVIGQGKGSVHYLDVGGRYLALQELTPTIHSFGRHIFNLGG